MRYGWLQKDDYNLVKEIVRGIFPDEKKISLTITKGRSAITYIVNNEWVVKIPDCSYSAECINNEIKVGQLLATADLPVAVSCPEKVEVELEKDGDSYIIECAVMEKLKGKHPEPFPNPKLSAQLGEFVGALHNVNVQADGALESEWNFMVYNILNKIDAPLSFHGFLRSTVMGSFYEQYVSQVCPVLCHGDLHLGNIIVDDKENLTGVIDFGQSIVGAKTKEFVVPGYLEQPFYEAYRSQCGEDYPGEERLSQLSVITENILDEMKSVCVRRAQAYKTLNSRPMLHERV